ncbi:MAG TPA: hypothetical protein VGC42_21910 [Kofleriaceae bacterium]
MRSSPGSVCPYMICAIYQALSARSRTARPLLMVRSMLSPSLQKNLGGPLQSRKAMLETLVRHLDMVRLSAGAILMFAAVGCTGLISGGSDGKTDEQNMATASWAEDAYPALKAACYGCHNGSRVGVGFLVGADADSVKKTLLAYTPAVINFDAPGSSRILSKGLHDGPALTASQASAILQWLQAEKTAQDHDPDHPMAVYKVAAFSPMICTAGVSGDPTCPTNHISLSTIDGIGPMLAGVEMSFTAQALSDSLYVTNLTLNGGTSGVYLEHPLFVSRPTGKDPIPDQIDRLFDVKENLAGGKTDVLDGGTHSFNGFDPAGMVEIHFKVVSAYKPDSGGTTVDPGACKKLADFKTDAVAQLNTNCAGCHAGTANAGAKSAMDLTGITSTDDAVLATTCAQVKGRINLVDTTKSGFYIAPDPAGGATHPFKFATAAAFTSFKTPVDVWVQLEKTAP